MPVLQHLQKYAKRFVGLALIGCVFLTYSSIAQAPLDVRVALIIGNAAYVNVPALANATNDAKAMANIMRKLGFKVFDVIDGDKASMERAIDQMKDHLKGQQAVAMLYYAGHGLQLDWRNYMVPINANLINADDVPRQTIDIEKVITTFKTSNTRMNIIILDACRDNPFSEKSSGKGLAQLDAPPGTYLAFATSPGNVAEDGDTESGNGLFTQFLIKELQKPARIEDVFKRVRLQVRQKSQGRQIPWDSSSLEEDFSFNDGARHTFNPEDLIKEAMEAKEKQERLKAEFDAAKQREIEIVRQREQERIRLAEERRQREVEAEAQQKRELEIAKQQELERQRLAEAQKIKQQLARQRAENESKERERLLVLAAEEQRRLALQAEKVRARAEAEAKDRERQLALAADAEKKRAQEAAQALDRARLAELQRLKDIEQAKAQSELESKLKKESADKQFEIQKADWDKIKDSKNVQDFYAFMLKYPLGYITEQATFAIANLEKSKLVAQPDKNGVTQIAGVSRFRLGDFTEHRTLDENGRIILVEKSTVTRIDQGLVYVNNSSDPKRSISGSLFKVETVNGTVTYDPPRLEIPGDEFVVGKKWTWRSWMQIPGRPKYQVESEVRIVAFEQVKVPAGTFSAYKINQVQRIDGSVFNRLECWYEPEWGTPLKCSRNFRTGSGGSTATVELVARSRVPN